MKKHKKQLHKRLLKLHRRIGLIAAIVVLILSITGIALEHTDDIGLDQRYINSSLLIDYYGIQADPIHSYAAADQFISHSGESFYLNGLALNFTSAELCGAVATSAGFALCNSEGIRLLNSDGSTLEQLDNDINLPAPAIGLGLSEQQLILITDSGNWLAGDDFLDWQPYPGAFKSVEPSNALPSDLSEEINQHSLSHEIHWERFLLDLHSGRIVGSWGKYLMDLAALALIYLSLSGVYVWWKKR